MHVPVTKSYLKRKLKQKKQFTFIFMSMHFIEESPLPLKE
jgi:hypothetical protein